MSKFTSFIKKHCTSPDLANKLNNYLDKAEKSTLSYGSSKIDPAQTTLAWIDEEASNTDITLGSLAKLTDVYARVKKASIEEVQGNDDQPTNKITPPNSLMQRLKVYTETDNISGTHYTGKQISSLATIIQMLNIDDEKTKKNIAKHVVENFKVHYETTLSRPNWGLSAFVEQEQDKLEDSWENIKLFVKNLVTSTNKNDILSANRINKIKRRLRLKTQTHTSKSIQSAMGYAAGFSSLGCTWFLMCDCATKTLSAGMIAGIVAAIVVTVLAISTSSVAIHGCRMKQMNKKQLSLFNEIIDGNGKHDDSVVTGVRVDNTQGGKIEE